MASSSRNEFSLKQTAIRTRWKPRNQKKFGKWRRNKNPSSKPTWQLKRRRSSGTATFNFNRSILMRYKWFHIDPGDIYITSTILGIVFSWMKQFIRIKEKLSEQLEIEWVVFIICKVQEEIDFNSSNEKFNFLFDVFCKSHTGITWKHEALKVLNYKIQLRL